MFAYRKLKTTQNYVIMSLNKAISQQVLFVEDKHRSLFTAYTGEKLSKQKKPDICPKNGSKELICPMHYLYDLSTSQ